jgi:hypothetical protein
MKRRSSDKPTDHTRHRINWQLFVASVACLFLTFTCAAEVPTAYFVGAESCRVATRTNTSAGNKLEWQTWSETQRSILRLFSAISRTLIQSAHLVWIRWPSSTAVDGSNGISQNEATTTITSLPSGRKEGKMASVSRRGGNRLVGAVLWPFKYGQANGANL